jgi:hypothetical protein
MMKSILRSAFAVTTISAVSAHDIYTGVTGKQGALCCGGSDCSATSYREREGRFESLTREQEWIGIDDIFLYCAFIPPGSI